MPIIWISRILFTSATKCFIARLCHFCPVMASFINELWDAPECLCEWIYFFAVSLLWRTCKIDFQSNLMIQQIRDLRGGIKFADFLAPATHLYTLATLWRGGRNREKNHRLISSPQVHLSPHSFAVYGLLPPSRLPNNLQLENYEIAPHPRNSKHGDEFFPPANWLPIKYKCFLLLRQLNLVYNENTPIVSL